MKVDIYLTHIPAQPRLQPLEREQKMLFLYNLHTRKRSAFFESYPWLKSWSCLRPGTIRVSHKDPCYFILAAQGSYWLWSPCGGWLRREDTWRMDSSADMSHGPWEPTGEFGKHPMHLSSDLLRTDEASLSLGSHCWQGHLSPTSNSIMLKCPQFHTHTAFAVLWAQMGVAFDGSRSVLVDRTATFFPKKMKVIMTNAWGKGAGHSCTLILWEGCVIFSCCLDILSFSLF